MLRIALIVVGAALFLAALFAIIVGLFAPGLIVLLVWSAMLVAGLAFERYRYKRLLPLKPGVGWEMTKERFIDPATSRQVRVYFQPASGKRVYVGEDD